MFSYSALLATLGTVHGFPQFNITENDQSKTLYLVGTGQGFNNTISSLSVPKNNRVYFTTSDAIEPDNNYMPNLLGGSIEYDLDISNTGCSCDFAVYLTRMPWMGADGKPKPQDDNTYYCDANGIQNGAYCPNFDIHESNTFNFMARAKSCSPPDRFEHYSKCNETGQCTRSTWDLMKDQFAPNDTAVINTKQPFHVKVSFDEEANYVIELSQNDQLIELSSDNDCKHDLSELKYALAAGMNLVVSHWGSKNADMKWLNADSECTGDCDGNPISTISNIVYKTGTAEVPPMPCAWDYGEQCSTAFDGDCGKEPQCQESKGETCNWSWAWDDPDQWNSKDAKCRCKGVKSQKNQSIVNEFIQ